MNYGDNTWIRERLDMIEAKINALLPHDKRIEVEYANSDLGRIKRLMDKDREARGGADAGAKTP